MFFAVNKRTFSDRMNEYHPDLTMVDVEHCPNCCGALKIIAAPSTTLRTGIDDPPVIVKILSHLGLPTRGPPRAPARRVDLFQTI
jgi:hypothetical protein